MTEILDTTTLTVPLPNLPGAACKGMDTEPWFSPDPDGQAYARTVCATCPVRLKCLAWALEAGERFGIWGGLDPYERRLARRRMR